MHRRKRRIAVDPGFGQFGVDPRLGRLLVDEGGAVVGIVAPLHADRHKVAPVLARPFDIRAGRGVGVAPLLRLRGGAVVGKGAEDPATGLGGAAVFHHHVHLQQVHHVRRPTGLRHVGRAGLGVGHVTIVHVGLPLQRVGQPRHLVRAERGEQELAHDRALGEGKTVVHCLYHAGQVRSLVRRRPDLPDRVTAGAIVEPDRVGIGRLRLVPVQHLRAQRAFARQAVIPFAPGRPPMLPGHVIPVLPNAVVLKEEIIGDRAAVDVAVEHVVAHRQHIPHRVGLEIHLQDVRDRRVERGHIFRKIVGEDEYRAVILAGRLHVSEIWKTDRVFEPVFLPQRSGRADRHNSSGAASRCRAKHFFIPFKPTFP